MKPTTAMRLLTFPLFLAAALYVTPLVHAQSAERGMDFGIKAGISFTDFVLAGDIDSEGRTGINAGVFLSNPVNPWSDLYVEAAYVQKGNYSIANLPAEGDEPFGDIVRIDARWDFASMLVAGRPFATFEGSDVELYGLLGPRADLLIGRRFGARDIDFRFSDLEASDRHPDFILGYVVGFGMDFGGVLPVPLLFEFRYNGDITEAYEGARHRALDLRIGMSF